MAFVSTIPRQYLVANHHASINMKCAVRIACGGGTSCGTGLRRRNDTSYLLNSIQQRMASTSTTPTASTPSSATYSMFRNLTVPNEGSIARDILAAERTFLAWGRTGLGFVGAGSALFAAYHNREVDASAVDGVAAPADNAGMRNKKDSSIDSATTAYPTILDEVIPACGILITNGVFLLGFATRRYINVVHALQHHNSFPIYVGGTLFAVITTAAGTVTSLAIVARARYNQIKKKDPRKSSINV